MGEWTTPGNSTHRFHPVCPSIPRPLHRRGNRDVIFSFLPKDSTLVHEEEGKTNAGRAGIHRQLWTAHLIVVVGGLRLLSRQARWILQLSWNF